ncbi:hypothetical protein HYH03_003457 [Edaphochlamys debaryana]|uniref:phytol kinase n=1 Tax=Edaphochlamys debaryana TaxID=47281 RepID=A0A836C4F4_9CHLO|nr:hypothetical protein HYH03_003457 [Edaphochlamys debaryana]|eukprot:KAG2498717.1 hypothetical protein HYH03_003457 [Edaphochlamys debaryana]
MLAESLLVNEAFRVALLKLIAFATRLPPPDSGGDSAALERKRALGFVSCELAMVLLEVSNIDDSPALIAARAAFTRSLLKMQMLHAAARQLADAANTLPVPGGAPNAGQGPGGSGAAGANPRLDRAHCNSLYGCLARAMMLPLCITAASDRLTEGDKERHDLLAGLAETLAATRLTEHAARLLLLLRGSQPDNLNCNPTAAVSYFLYTYKFCYRQVHSNAAAHGDASMPPGVLAQYREVLQGPCARHAVMVLGLTALDRMDCLPPDANTACRCLRAGPPDKDLNGFVLPALIAALDAAVQGPEEAPCSPRATSATLSRAAYVVVASMLNDGSPPKPGDDRRWLSPEERLEVAIYLLPVAVSNARHFDARGRPQKGLWREAWDAAHLLVKHEVCGQGMTKPQRGALSRALGELVGATVAPLRVEGAGGGTWRLPAQPPAIVDCALRGSALPCLDRMLRRASLDPGSMEAKLLCSEPMLSPDLWAGALALLAYASPSQAAAFAANATKLLRRTDARLLLRGAAEPDTVGLIAVVEMCRAVLWVSSARHDGASTEGLRRLTLFLSAALPDCLAELSRLVLEAAALHTEAWREGRGRPGEVKGEGDEEAGKGRPPYLCRAMEALMLASKAYCPGRPPPSAPSAVATAAAAEPKLGAHGGGPCKDGEGSSSSGGGGGDGSGRSKGLTAGSSEDGSVEGADDSDWRWAVLEGAKLVAVVGAALGLQGGRTSNTAPYADLRGLASTTALSLVFERPQALRGLVEALRTSKRDASLAPALESLAVLLEAAPVAGAVRAEGDVGRTHVGQGNGERPREATLADFMLPPSEARSCLGFRPCSSPACVELERDNDSPPRLRQCGGCGRASYCCRACQTAHWRAGHKAECGGGPKAG